MSTPELLSMTATVKCECGEEIEFDGIEDGWQHIWPCDCERYVSLQIGDPIVQYDNGGRMRSCGFDMGEGDTCLLAAGHEGTHS